APPGGVCRCGTSWLVPTPRRCSGTTGSRATGWLPWPLPRAAPERPRPRRRRACRAAASLGEVVLPSLELFFGKGSEERFVVDGGKAPCEPTQDRLGLLRLGQRHEPRVRLAGLGQHDLLAGMRPFEELRELRLRLVHVD